jgi:hypothetical protein
MINGVALMGLNALVGLCGIGMDQVSFDTNLYASGLFLTQTSFL